MRWQDRSGLARKRILLLVTGFVFLKPVIRERAGPTAADCQ